MQLSCKLNFNNCSSRVNMQLLLRMSLASKKAIAMKVMAASNIHEVMQGISGMAGMVSDGSSHRKINTKVSTRQQKLDDLEIVVGWALRERVKLVGIQETMANGGVLRLSSTNIEDR